MIIILFPDEYDGELQEDPPPASGIEDCGPFKKVWSYRYLCYNLGKEILCLLCFCRFTQFKKFNLDRHMRNKHQSLYHIDDETKKKILDVVGCRCETLSCCDCGCVLVRGEVRGVRHPGHDCQCAQSGK